MKKFTVRYQTQGKTVISSVSTISEVKKLISQDAKSSAIETKPSQNMPVPMHNLIAKHNASV